MQPSIKRQRIEQFIEYNLPKLQPGRFTPLEILFVLAVSISWKVSITIAILSYIGFQHVADIPLTPAQDLNSLSDSIYRSIFVSFSKVLQYVTPLVFIVGAGVSAFKNKQRGQLLDRQSSLESIRAMQALENLLCWCATHSRVLWCYDSRKR